MEHVLCTKCRTTYTSRLFEGIIGRKHCPKCGSSVRALTESIEEGIKFHEAWQGKIKDPSLPSKKKIRVWFFDGYQWSVLLGKFVKKSVTGDKRADLYHEKVTDPDTGEIIYESSGTVRGHTDHGSAKFKESRRKP